jgi:hypothetical protein
MPLPNSDTIAPGATELPLKLAALVNAVIRTSDPLFASIAAA